MSEEAPAVLVVDDEPPIREFLRLLLTEAGFAVVTATDGVEAQAFLRRQRIDLILTDIYMPGEDGLGLLRAAKAVVPPVPVVVFSAETDLDFDPLRQAERLGAAAVLRKPLDPARIVATARRVLSETYNSRLATNE